MERVHRYRKSLFWAITLFMACVAAILNFGIHFGINWIMLEYSSEQGQGIFINNIPQVFEWLFLLKDNFYLWGIPACLIICLLFGWVLWGVISLSVLKGSNQAEHTADKEQASNSAKKDFVAQKIEQERRRRIYFHSLSLLQREGRLLDFFDEDLDHYNDSQIGAAVRSIQEDCKKAIKKYIDPKPVVAGSEGDFITIEAGFDIDAIKLVGNVAGKPPFKGLIKHPGWKANKKDVPKLSDVKDAGIMTPAEIEVQ